MNKAGRIEMGDWWIEKLCFAMIGMNIGMGLTSAVASGYRMGTEGNPVWVEVLVWTACLFNFVGAGWLWGTMNRIRGRSER